MATPNLLVISIAAFISVFFVLIVLALIMRIIITLFPEKEKDDTAVYAAISVAFNKMYPGTQISKIEELT